MNTRAEAAGADRLIGVLALQGGVAEHVRHLTNLGARTRLVRRASELDGLDAIVIPGGESTTMCRLMDTFDLRAPLKAQLDLGMPAFGTCAGMILLAQQILDGRPDQRSLPAIDITLRRNAFGRQAESFECDLDVVGLTSGPFRAVFIRAPWIESVGSRVEVLARINGRAVAARQGGVLVTSFHPEVLPDNRIHRMFLDMVTARRPRAAMAGLPV